MCFFGWVLWAFGLEIVHPIWQQCPREFTLPSWTCEVRTTEDTSPKFVYFVLRNVRRPMSPDYLPILLCTLDHDENADLNRSGGKKFLGRIVPGNFWWKSGFLLYGLLDSNRNLFADLHPQATSLLSCLSANFGRMNSSLHVNAISVELSVQVSVFSNCK